jgi:hypothetical protein
VVVGFDGRETQRQRFWAEIDRGVPLKQACAVTLVPHGTGYRWLRSVGRSVRADRPPLAVRRELFWKALSTGVTIKAASRAAGVSRNSGARWFAQAGGVRAKTKPDAESRASRGVGALTFADRCSIEELLGQGYQPARIATLLGRARSTISRELAPGAPCRWGQLSGDRGR